MTVGIVGLGLIGGSMAKAYKTEGHTVYAFNRDRSVVEFAKIDGMVDDELSAENMKECQLILLALYPEAVIKWLEDNGSFVSGDCIVMDLCGTKRVVCEACFPIAEKYGFTFVGGHPMAGTHFSGYKYSRATMFKGAPMIIVPPTYDDIVLYDKVETLLEPAHFGKFTVTTPEKHDSMIAFTSQMAHVVSNAYIKSPTAKQHKGFSAGSYRDLTRVAWLNPQMWTELFLENRENLIFEIDYMINSLKQYRDAMETQDYDTLCRLLDEGKRCKEEVDGR